MRWVEGCDVFGYVRDVRGDKLRERLSERRLLFQACTDESPSKEVSKFGFGSMGTEIGRTIRAVRTDHQGIVGDDR